jgi:hypothetical protein
MTACGESSHARRSPSSATSSASQKRNQPTVPSAGYPKWDGDPDGDDEGRRYSAGREDARPLLAAYPQLPSDSERQTIATIVKSYFAAALAGDGASACRLLAASIASGFTAGGVPSERGSGSRCIASLDQLFEQEHRRLAADEPSTMTITSVRLKGDAGMVFLGFRSAPETEILVSHEDGAWKLDALVDSVLP